MTMLHYIIINNEKIDIIAKEVRISPNEIKISILFKEFYN